MASHGQGEVVTVDSETGVLIVCRIKAQGSRSKASWISVILRNYRDVLTQVRTQPNVSAFLTWATGIAFGTAGLRAKVEAGFARMNCLTVIQTSQGLAEHVIKRSVGKSQPKAVIGYDGRHDSHRFAELAAAAFLSKGFSVIWFRAVVHTPLVPFAVRSQRADVGVMITASHNPKDDNGYKVYGSNACQINSPEDLAIAQAIKENLEPITWDVSPVSLLEDCLDRIRSDYVEQIAKVVRLKSPVPNVVYTPMHGVGLDFFLHVMHRLLPIQPGDQALGEIKMEEHPTIKVVPQQAYPDPDFSTVTYPNPEENAALDLAKLEAEKLGLKIIIANDPDADRFAAAQELSNGTWYQFKGDEVGALLGSYIITKWRRQHSLNNSRPLMITSAVSSQMLAAIGNREGFVVQETLTGFKWIGNKALDAGAEALFGYEEALGYMLPNIVHDKDGISAACLFLEACSEWKRQPYDVLQDLYKAYGFFETMNTYWKSPNVDLTKAVFERIRMKPTLVLDSLAPSTRCRIRDALSGTDTGTVDRLSTLPVLSDNMMITLWLSNNSELQEGVRLTIRASGTEPKIKGKIQRRCFV